VRAPHQVERLGVGRAAREETFEGVAGVVELPGVEVGGADLAPDIVLRVTLVARDDLAEVLDGLGVPPFGARDDAELVVRVGLLGVDLDGAGETRAGLGQLPTLLVDEPEVVVGRGVGRVERGGLQVLPEGGARLPRPHGLGEVAAQEEEEEQEQQRRREHRPEDEHQQVGRRQAQAAAQQRRERREHPREAEDLPRPDRRP
jgi:hypothetical protein